MSITKIFTMKDNEECSFCHFDGDEAKKCVYIHYSGAKHVLCDSCETHIKPIADHLGISMVKLCPLCFQSGKIGDNPKTYTCGKLECITELETSFDEVIKDSSLYPNERTDRRRALMNLSSVTKKRYNDTMAKIGIGKVTPADVTNAQECLCGAMPPSHVPNGIHCLLPLQHNTQYTLNPKGA